MDWGPLYKKLAEAYHWTPEQVRSLTLHDVEILIFNRSEASQHKTWSAEEQLRRRNEIRAKTGKPPIQPRVRHGRATKIS